MRHTTFGRHPVHPEATRWERPGFNILKRHSRFAHIGFFDGHLKAMKHRTLWNGGNPHPDTDRNQ